MSGGGHRLICPVQGPDDAYLNVKSADVGWRVLIGNPRQGEAQRQPDRRGVGCSPVNGET